MSIAYAMTPAELSASVEARAMTGLKLSPAQRKAAKEYDGPISHSEIRRKATPKAGQSACATHGATASPTHTSGEAVIGAQPTTTLPLAGFPIVDGLNTSETHCRFAIDTLIPAAIFQSLPIPRTPQEYPTAADLPRYTPTHATSALIQDIVETHRQRQTNIKAKTKLILQAKALLRSALCTDADFEDDDTKEGEVNAYGAAPRKLTKAAAARVDAAMKLANAEPDSHYGLMVAPYLGGIELFDARQKTLEKALVKLAKQLPAYDWAKSVKGLGDVSFATLVGECGDIGTYKSIAAVWKRLGLAVMSGQRQGNPGKGAAAEDWVAHGYNRARRSVSWNARNGIIGGMGMWRPLFGEDVRANPDLTEYQCVFAERARYESEKLGLPIVESDKGKESYKAHAVARAFRYTEKRMIKHMYLAWRA